MSKSAVADVLRGRPGYSRTTQDRVHKVAQRLGYRPNYLGKALGGGRSMSIAAIWPLRGITRDIDVAMAMLAEAEDNGYVTYQTEYRDDLSWLRQAIQQFADRRVDALLLWCDAIFLRELVDELNALPLAVVVTSNEPVAGLTGDLLVHDRYRAIEEVVDHFVLAGRRSLTMIRGNPPSEQTKEDVFRARCRFHGVSDAPRSIAFLEAEHLSSDLVAQYQATMESFFREGIDADALLCCADEGAAVALRFLKAQGRSVPDDVAVAGWNNLATDSLWHPALASIDRSHGQMIAVLLEMLASRLKDRDLAPRLRTVPMRFVWRESAGGAGLRPHDGGGPAVTKSVAYEGH